MDTYTIKKAYHWTNDNEIEIKSENLIFIELCNGGGCQSTSGVNNDEILKRCYKIADLIREIEVLNQSK
jgi:hypothetical protein